MDYVEIVIGWDGYHEITKSVPARRAWQRIGAPRNALLAILWVLGWLSTISVWLPVAAVVLCVQLVNRHNLIVAARNRRCDEALANIFRMVGLK
jgi:hypothetical protein